MLNPQQIQHEPEKTTTTLTDRGIKIPSSNLKHGTCLIVNAFEFRLL